jgi:propionate CoA-transferase
VLTEIAPGVDLQRDILAHMGFRPEIFPNLKEMDSRIFVPESMGYIQDLLKKPCLNLPSRLKKVNSESNE